MQSQRKKIPERHSDADLQALGVRIRKIRGEMLQEDFAAQLGISQGQLSKIERGKLAPSLDVLVCISLGYGKTLDWIVWGE